MYEARKICNLLLSCYDARRFGLTNLRLNKMLYFIQAESLSGLPEGLVRNHFEAWEYGPVIRPVFDSFKRYENSWISAQATYLDYASGEQKIVPFEDLDKDHCELIKQIFDKYSSFTTNQLVTLSHVSGGPWDTVYRAYLADKTASPRISNDLIRRHYVTGEINLGPKH
jgi:uncharacterized phage-associated protein